ncbi:DUF3159 domain-containing protein [Actinotalea sp.]|uniref:DUF3159 domain-containing protein n=1 Tax=Actinotalea sp. TaxID=1872145 RepID=UPI0035669A42
MSEADGSPQEGPDPEGAATEASVGGTAGRGMRALLGDDFSFAEAVGGVRGVVESVAPGLVFVVVYLLTFELRFALIAASAVALIAVLLRLVQRTPVTQAFSGLLGVAIAVVWAWRTGEAEDFFLWGILVNVAYGAGTALSVMVRWPVVGVLVSLLALDTTMTWRTDPELDHLRRRYVWATWLWAGLFALRLVVQVPLYLAGAVGALGVAKLAMGVPLFAVVLWLTWLLVASPGARADRPDRHPDPRR